MGGMVVGRREEHQCGETAVDITRGWGEQLKHRVCEREGMPTLTAQTPCVVREGTRTLTAQTPCVVREGTRTLTAQTPCV